MARIKSRANVSGAGSGNTPAFPDAVKPAALGDLAAMGAPPAAAAPDAPAQTAASGLEADAYDYADEDFAAPDAAETPAAPASPAPAAAPAPRVKAARTVKAAPETVNKTYGMLKENVDSLEAALLAWHMEDPTRMKHFGGTASETAFVQALLGLGIEMISKNTRASARLMKHFPSNTRTRK